MTSGLSPSGGKANRRGPVVGVTVTSHGQQAMNQSVEPAPL